MKNESTKISQSSEIDVGGNIHELLVTRDPIRQADIAGDEIAANSVGPFLRRISESSRREIKHLIDRLQTLEKKLETDGDRIQRDIEEYANLGLNVMQLTAIIADSVKELPDAPGLKGIGQGSSYVSRPSY
jgi:CTP-dependent riboflavin kinase